MKFIEKSGTWGRRSTFVGRKKGFIFDYTNSNDGGFYVVVDHKSKDITFNSLWEDLTFETTEECETWCENFNYKNHKCNGDDI